MILEHNCKLAIKVDHKLYIVGEKYSNIHPASLSLEGLFATTACGNDSFEEW